MDHLNKPISIIIFCLMTHCCWCQQTICYGNVETYSVDMDERSGRGTQDSFYTWNVVGNGYVGEIILPEAGNTNEITIDWGDTPPGNYTLVVEEINMGCFGEQKRLDVTILPAPVSGLAPGFICREPTTGEILDTARLDTGLSESLFSFEWYFEDMVLSHTGSFIMADRTGGYGVVITNKQTGCQVLDATTVAFSSSASAEVLVDPHFGEVQRILVNIVQGTGVYEFALDDGDFQDRPEFLVTEAGTYKVTIRDKNGCGEIVLVANVLTFPKFFTPNNDGYNDFWNIDGAQPIMDADVSIYNRQGQLIAHIDGRAKGWDGSYNGKPLPSDDYWFVVEYVNGLQMNTVFKSHFTLKR